ncbi:MAG: hypothetical protein I8H71_09225 [Xanthomonadaceae bacterium]|nr:hypothetical protein [Xanthomonadaceae bacterium]
MNALIRPDRRHFLKQAAGAGLVAGMGPLLVGCGGGDADTRPAAGATEIHSYFFDLSNAHPETDFFLVSGTRHHPLVPATAAQLEKAKAGNPVLQSVSSQSVTHMGIGLALPARLQMCYVKGVPRGGKRGPGEWDMHTMFYHVPSAASSLAAEKLTQSCGKSMMASQRAAYQACLNDIAGTASAGGLNALAANNSLCTGTEFDQFKDYFDHAMALICHHPEIGSFDAPTLSYVQQAIVCADINLLNLAVSLYRQGPATTTPGGWATLVEYTKPDPTTGEPQPQLASNGDKLYFTHHSAETLQLTGTAINSILPKVKNDPMLGGNIADLSASELNDGLQGKMWVTQSGTPTRLPATQSTLLARSLQASSGASWTARDLSSGNGFRVTDIGGGARTVSFTVENWYLRYLGLYVRFLDGAGNPMAVSSLPQETQLQFVPALSGTYDAFLSLVNQELVVLGIPIRQNKQSYSVTVPDSAASIQILAGGLGSGSNSYPHTVTPGAVMTVVLDLAVPGIFLALSAVDGYASLTTELSTQTQLLIDSAKIFLLTMTDAVVGGVYKDASVFTNLAGPLASTLKDGATALYAEIKANVKIGEAEEAVASCIPFGIGLAFQAVMALGVAAQIAETSAEIANAPWTFVTQVDATHDLTVTLNHDPLDTAGFPATATYYTLRAVCDGGSPAESGRIAMQGTTRTEPLSYTFNNLPAGGKVTVTAAFYSDTDWLTGAGSTGAVDNAQDAAALTIKENLVPLTTATQYAHKEKLGLDSSGKHIWIAGPQPAATPANCNNVSGSLCNLQGITVSETFGNVGYVWQSYSAGVPSFGSGAAGQLYQFANISFTQDPQSGWMHSGGGFPSPPRLAYSRSSPTSQNFYIDTSTGNAMVRRINMTQVGVAPTFDSPRGGQAVGSFNFPSDAFLIHPTGKLISINAALGKLEVLVPSATPVPDASAPLAQAFAGPGSREGLLNGPACAVVAPGGAILVLEQGGNRIQAFDTGANPAPFFAGQSTMQLKAQTGGVQYLDMAIEFVGYLYVLSLNSNTGIYSLDIYTPAGALLATTSGMNASKLAIDLFRNVYTLNFETIQPVGNLTEPSVSQWIPSTP